MVICHFLKTSMSFNWDYYSLLCLPETIRSVATQRQIMVICPFSKTLMSFDWDYWSLPCLLETCEFVGTRRLSWSSILIVFMTIEASISFQRHASSLARGDYHGNMFSFFSRLLKSPLPSKDMQVRWHAETIMVIYFHCFQDYWSLPCLQETIKSVGIRRQSWSPSLYLS